MSSPGRRTLATFCIFTVRRSPADCIISTDTVRSDPTRRSCTDKRWKNYKNVLVAWFVVVHLILWWDTRNVKRAQNKAQWCIECEILQVQQLQRHYTLRHYAMRNNKCLGLLLRLNWPWSNTIMRRNFSDGMLNDDCQDRSGLIKWKNKNNTYEYLYEIIYSASAHYVWRVWMKNTCSDREILR